jgi:hypothetical protein
MKVEKREDYTAVLLDDEEVMRLCRPGAGADTCIWLVVGEDGFECFYYNREVPSLTGETLGDRWRRGVTVAKRDGCDEAKKLVLDVTIPYIGG